MFSQCAHQPGTISSTLTIRFEWSGRGRLERASHLVSDKAVILSEANAREKGDARLGRPDVILAAGSDQTRRSDRRSAWHSVPTREPSRASPARTNATCCGPTSLAPHSGHVHNGGSLCLTKPRMSSTGWRQPEGYTPHPHMRQNVVGTAIVSRPQRPGVLRAARGRLHHRQGPALRLHARVSRGTTTRSIPLFFYGPASFVKDGGRIGVAAGRRADARRAARTAPPATTTGRALSQALAPGPRPRVVSLFVLDGMRADYFDTYRRRDADADRGCAPRGVVLQRARDVLPTVTGVGHATSAPEPIRASTASPSTTCSIASPANRRRPTTSSIPAS